MTSNPNHPLNCILRKALNDCSSQAAGLCCCVFFSSHFMSTHCRLFKWPGDARHCFVSCLSSVSNVEDLCSWHICRKFSWCVCVCQWVKTVPVILVFSSVLTYRLTSPSWRFACYIVYRTSIVLLSWIINYMTSSLITRTHILLYFLIAVTSNVSLLVGSYLCCWSVFSFSACDGLSCPVIIMNVCKLCTYDWL